MGDASTSIEQPNIEEQLKQPQQAVIRILCKHTYVEEEVHLFINQAIESS